MFSTFDQNFDFKIRREHQKNSYERRAYESVDVRSLFRVIPYRSKETSAPGLKGLTKPGEERLISPSHRMSLPALATTHCRRIIHGISMVQHISLALMTVLWKQLTVKCRVQITEFRDSFFTLCFEPIYYFSSGLFGNLETVYFSLSSSSPVVFFSSCSFIRIVSSLLVLQYGTQQLLGILHKLLLSFLIEYCCYIFKVFHSESPSL